MFPAFVHKCSLTIMTKHIWY